LEFHSFKNASARDSLVQNDNVTLLAAYRRRRRRREKKGFFDGYAVLPRRRAGSNLAGSVSLKIKTFFFLLFFALSLSFYMYTLAPGVRNFKHAGASAADYSNRRIRHLIDNSKMLM